MYIWIVHFLNHFIHYSRYSYYSFLHYSNIALHKCMSIRAIIPFFIYKLVLKENRNHILNKGTINKATDVLGSLRDCQKN